MGQARKSLWIETVSWPPSFSAARGQACGSKPLRHPGHAGRYLGQARKSLWIETTTLVLSSSSV